MFDNKKKLLMYVDSVGRFGGIERVIINLANKFVKYYDVTILVKDKSKSVYNLDENIQIETLDAELKMDMNSRIHRIVSVLFNIFKSIIKLKKFLHKNEYDYIYTAFPTNGLEIYLSNKKYRKRIVASEHASYYAYNKIYKKIKKWLYPRLSAISVPTSMDTDIYVKLGYNAYYIPHLTTYENVINNDVNSKIVINVGRLTGDKQQELLLDIWEEVNHRIVNNDWKLLIIGSGEEKEHIKQHIEKNNLENVKLIEHTSNIDDYYKKAALFVFTSKMEGFGMVLLEAMAFRSALYIV